MGEGDRASKQQAQKPSLGAPSSEGNSETHPYLNTLPTGREDGAATSEHSGSISEGHMTQHLLPRGQS